MVAGDHKFHPECFRCESCCSFIGDGESYALVERSKLYWFVLFYFFSMKFFFNLIFILISGQCYRRQMQPLSRTAQTVSKKPLHSIRLVEIPWTKANKGGIRLSVDENQIGAPISSAAGFQGVRISE